MSKQLREVLIASEYPNILDEDIMETETDAQIIQILCVHLNDNALQCVNQ